MTSRQRTDPRAEHDAATDSSPSPLTIARETLAELGLTEVEGGGRPVSGHQSSLLLPCTGQGGQRYLLKWFVEPTDHKYYPTGVRLADYARREGAFYRFLDSIDAQRRDFPAPRTILIDPKDPPQWILLEYIPGAVGPADEVLSVSHVTELIDKLRGISLPNLLGRRDFPLNHWDLVGMKERIRLLYEHVIDVIGDDRWRRAQEFFIEATRWAESRPLTFVHGDFTTENIVIDPDGDPFLVDFERVGVGHEDHDFAWLWIHSDRPQSWKRSLLERYLGHRVGSERVRAEWGIRSSLVYLALRRLRFGALKFGDEDSLRTRELALLDAALAGGVDLFPI